MTTYCGYAALVGRPNVGKSTLLNRLLNKKISITSRKPQTTRHSILGINTEDPYQIVYVDTPGLHQDQHHALNKVMNKTAIASLRDADIVILLLDATRLKADDEYILKLIIKDKLPTILVLNKIDRMADKGALLPFIEAMSARYKFIDIIPLSAKSGTGVDNLTRVIQQHLPEGPFFFGPEDVTDRPVTFLCAEMLREKIFRLSGQELPYSVNVEIESFKEEENLFRIHALIVVNKENHKRMIIGDKGAKMREIATKARLDMEKILGKKVFLQCWCKVKPGWNDNPNLLRQYGYDHRT